jgi:hypothetical protein
MQSLKMRKRWVDGNEEFRVGVVELAGEEPFVQRIEEGSGYLKLY